MAAIASWSLFFTARTPAVARARIEREPVLGGVWAYGLPQAVKDVLLATLAATDIPEDKGVHVECTGYGGLSTHIRVDAVDILE